MPPEAVVVTGPSLAVAWERSFSAAASVLRFSPCAYAGLEGGLTGRRRGTYLVSCAAGQGAQGALDGAGGLVEVRLSGGSLVLVGRHGCFGVFEESMRYERGVA